VAFTKGKRRGKKRASRFKEIGSGEKEAHREKGRRYDEHGY